MIETLLEDAREAVEVDGFAVGGLGGRHQVIEIVRAEIETLAEEGAELRALLLADNAVDRRDMIEERRRGEAGLVGGDRFRFSIAAEVGEESLEGRDHSADFAWDARG